VSVKISSYFSDLGCVIKDLDKIGVAGISMFNRFYTPDININNESLQAASVLSEQNEYHLPLRWVGLMAGRLQCQLAATTGIHNAETAIKLLLAGADAVQMASVFYQQGIDCLPAIIAETEKWMNEKGYESLSDFKGKLSFTKAPNPGWYERVQFMTYFGEYNA
jgi:dihydroorotate dehydrogenase (fumarate)